MVRYTSILDGGGCREECQGKDIQLDRAGLWRYQEGVDHADCEVTGQPRPGAI